MSAKLEALSQQLQDRFGDKLLSKKLALGELTVEVAAADYLSIMQALRDEAEFSFEEMIDLCGVDYSDYGAAGWQGKRFAVVVHLLSLAHNRRLRCVFLPRTMNFRQSIRSRRCGPVPAGSGAGVRPVRDCFCRSRRPSSHPDRLWFHRPPVPQGFPDFRACRDALRPRSGACRLSARDH